MARERLIGGLGTLPLLVAADLSRLIEDDQRTKAACWAYFAGDEGQAIKILLNSDGGSLFNFGKIVEHVQERHGRPSRDMCTQSTC